MNKGWPTGALKLLNQKYVKNLLDNVEIDQQKELIAKGYFLANKNELAIKYAKEAIGRSKENVSFANWTAGLSAWRLNDFESAANFQHWTEQTGGSVQGLLTSLTALVTESTTKDFYLAPELALENHPNFDQYKSEFKKLISDRLGTTETT